MSYHQPVLVDAVMTHLIGVPASADLAGPNPSPPARESAGGRAQPPAADAPYLDGTVGGGGHAEELLARCPRCRLVAVDRDPAALDAARTRLLAYSGRVRFTLMSFRDIAADAELRREGLAGALLDLGASSRQFDSDRRGFTFRRGAPLDMRMNPESAPTAAAFLARAGRRELADALRAGQAPRPGALSARIVQRRAERPLRTSDDLVAVLESVLARRSTHAEKARLFQAIRIRVNDEIGALTEALPAIRDLLLPRRGPGRDRLPLRRGPGGQARLPRLERSVARPAAPASGPGSGPDATRINDHSQTGHGRSGRGRGQPQGPSGETQGVEEGSMRNARRNRRRLAALVVFFVVAALGSMTVVAWRQSVVHVTMDALEVADDELDIAVERMNTLRREVDAMETRAWIGAEATRRLGLRNPRQHEVVITTGAAP